MVPAYKKFGGQVVLSVAQIFFNDLLSSPCSTIDHRNFEIKITILEADTYLTSR